LPTLRPPSEAEAARRKLADQVHDLTLECAKLSNEVATLREQQAARGQVIDLPPVPPRAVN
jgi:hypothetical protein